MSDKKTIKGLILEMLSESNYEFRVALEEEIVNKFDDLQSKLQALEEQNKVLVELIKKADDLADDVHQRKDIGDGLPGRTSFYLGEYISARQALASLKGDG